MCDGFRLLEWCLLSDSITTVSTATFSHTSVQEVCHYSRYCFTALFSFNRALAYACIERDPCVAFMSVRPPRYDVASRRMHIPTNCFST